MSAQGEVLDLSQHLDTLLALADRRIRPARRSTQSQRLLHLSPPLERLISRSSV